MLTWHEVWVYLRLLLRWWPVLAVSVLLATSTAWLLTRDNPDYYVAQSSVMVGNYFNTNTPSRGAVDLANVLAGYYEVVLRREVIMAPAIKRLGLDLPWDYVAWSMIATNVNPSANLLEIRVTDSNAERAAALANALAEQLVIFSPNSPEKIETQRREIEHQLNETQTLIDGLDQKIADLEARQSSLDSALDIRDIADQLDTLKVSRERYQSTYNDLLLLRDNSTANTLSIFERATVPKYPLPQKRLLVLGIAGGGGLVLAIIAVLLLDLLDTRWRPDPALGNRLGVSILGWVRYDAQLRFGSKDAEARQRDVRETYTNIVLQARNTVPRTVLVSSPRPSELRSAFAIDLADVYAQSGLRVLLVDAEFVKPHVTRLLFPDAHNQPAVPPDPGSGALERWSSADGRSYELPPYLWVRLRKTPLMNIVLLPSQDDDSETLPLLVPSLHWPELVAGLRQTADIVIFDGPSLLTGADSGLLAPHVDGVVLALNPATDSRSEIAASKKRLLANESTRLLGAVTIEQTGKRSRDEQGAGRAAPRSAKRGGFGISIDSGGITLRLPSRHAIDEGPDVRSHSAVDSGAPTVDGPFRARAVGAEPYEDRTPSHGEVRDSTVSHGGGRQTGQTEALVTPPPPTVLVTPVFVTPAEAQGMGPRARARGTPGRMRARRRRPAGSEPESDSSTPDGTPA